MSFKKKQLIKLSVPMLIFLFAMTGMSGCSSNNNASGKISFNAVPDIVTTPPCPDIGWFYSDHISSQRCIKADNYLGGSGSSGLQVAGVCSGAWTNVTTGYNQLEYSDVIIDCASGNVMSSSDINLTNASLPASPSRPASIGDMITYQVICYAYGEKRAQESYNYTSTYSGTCT